MTGVLQSWNMEILDSYGSFASRAWKASEKRTQVQTCTKPETSRASTLESPGEASPLPGCVLPSSTSVRPTESLPRVDDSPSPREPAERTNLHAISQAARPTLVSATTRMPVLSELLRGTTPVGEHARPRDATAESECPPERRTIAFPNSHFEATVKDHLAAAVPSEKGVSVSSPAEAPTCPRPAPPIARGRSPARPRRVTSGASSSPAVAAPAASRTRDLTSASSPPRIAQPAAPAGPLRSSPPAPLPQPPARPATPPRHSASRHQPCDDDFAASYASPLPGMSRARQPATSTATASQSTLVGAAARLVASFDATAAVAASSTARLATMPSHRGTVATASPPFNGCAESLGSRGDASILADNAPAVDASAGKVGGDKLSVLSAAVTPDHVALPPDNLPAGAGESRRGLQADGAAMNPPCADSQTLSDGTARVRTRTPHNHKGGGVERCPLFVFGDAEGGGGHGGAERWCGGELDASLSEGGGDSGGTSRGGATGAARSSLETNAQADAGVPVEHIGGPIRRSPVTFGSLAAPAKDSRCRGDDDCTKSPAFLCAGGRPRSPLAPMPSRPPPRSRSSSCLDAPVPHTSPPWPPSPSGSVTVTLVPAPRPPPSPGLAATTTNRSSSESRCPQSWPPPPGPSSPSIPASPLPVLAPRSPSPTNMGGTAVAAAVAAATAAAVAAAAASPIPGRPAATRLEQPLRQALGGGVQTLAGNSAVPRPVVCTRSPLVRAHQLQPADRTISPLLLLNRDDCAHQAEAIPAGTSALPPARSPPPRGGLRDAAAAQPPVVSWPVRPLGPAAFASFAPPEGRPATLSPPTPPSPLPPPHLIQQDGGLAVVPPTTRLRRPTSQPPAERVHAAAQSGTTRPALSRATTTAGVVSGEHVKLSGLVPAVSSPRGGAARPASRASSPTLRSECDETAPVTLSLRPTAPMYPRSPSPTLFIGSRTTGDLEERTSTQSPVLRALLARRAALLSSKEHVEIGDSGVRATADPTDCSTASQKDSTFPHPWIPVSRSPLAFPNPFSAHFSR